MNLAEQRRFSLTYFRWYKRHERKAYRLVRTWLASVRDGVLSMLDRFGIGKTLSSVNDLVKISSIKDLLNRIYQGVLPEAARNEFNRLKPNIPNVPGQAVTAEAGFFSQVWQNTTNRMLQDAETAAKVTKIAETTRGQIRRVLIQANLDNVDVRTAARRIRTVLGGKGADTRALMIARTETTRAANAGHEAGAASTSLKLEKRWVPTADARTRQDHLAMFKSKPVEKDGYFIVGGMKMRYPGDPAGGAKQCVNCRCTHVYQPA